MLTLFHRKTVPQSALASAPETAKGLLRPESAATLLATPRRQKLLEHIWQRTSLSRRQFAVLYRAPLERYAVLVQQFPASESHHHAYPGGMLDHGLESIAYALKLRQSYLLPVGAQPETQAAQAEAWTAGAAYAAMLHDIGKIAVDLHVEYADGKRWYPWHGPLEHAYRFRYRRDRAYRLHGAAAGLLYTDILDKAVLDWLCGFPELWASLLYVLAGQYEHAGVLGELVQQADRASVAQELGGDPAKARVAPKHALQRKLLDGLRYLLKEELKLNQPQASDGWLTQDALWLVSKTVCDKLRAHLLSQGIEGIPSTNIAVFNVLQDHGIVQPTADNKAIWKATVTSDSWSHSFTFLKLAPALIWESGERPAPFIGAIRIEENAGVNTDDVITTPTTTPSPSSRAATSTRVDNIAAPDIQASSDDAVGSALALLGDVSYATSKAEDVSNASVKTATKLQPAPPPSADACASHNSTIDLEDSLGAQFITWLRKSIHTRSLKINDAKALIHTVAGTAYLVSPGIFQRYIQEHTDIARLARQKKMTDWEWVQKNFERLHMHKKQNSGLNIWTCEVTGARKSRRVHGYLLTDGQSIFAEVPADNPYLRLQ